MMRVFALFQAYWNAKRLKFDSRERLERHQQRQLQRFMSRCLAHSPWFAPFLSRPLHTWPLMDKAAMMQHFDRMNTAGLKLDEVLACAMQAEQSRDFNPTVRGYSVGLSSGTSGSRGVFVMSPAEQSAWAGVVLARLLPRGLFSGERIALFLRANNKLYPGLPDDRIGAGGLILFGVVAWYIHRSGTWPAGWQPVFFTLIFAATLALGGLSDGRRWGLPAWTALALAALVALLRCPGFDPLGTMLLAAWLLHGAMAWPSALRRAVRPSRKPHTDRK